MSIFRYLYTGETGAHHPILGELIKNTVYTSPFEMAGPNWSAPSDTAAKPAAAEKPGKEKSK